MTTEFLSGEAEPELEGSSFRDRFLISSTTDVPKKTTPLIQEVLRTNKEQQQSTSHTKIGHVNNNDDDDDDDDDEPPSIALHSIDKESDGISLMEQMIQDAAATKAKPSFKEENDNANTNTNNTNNNVEKTASNNRNHNVSTEGSNKKKGKKTNNASAGFKKGFLLGGKTKKKNKKNTHKDDPSKTKTKTKTTTANQVIHLETAKPSSSSLLLPEIQQQQAAWVATPDLLQRIGASSPLMEAMKDPNFARVLETVQKEPSKAPQIFKQYPDYATHIYQICGLIGMHLNDQENADDQSSSKDPLQEKADQLLQNPMIRQALMDPEIQQIMTECASSPGKFRQYATHPIHGPKLKLLHDSGLLQLQ